MTALDPPIRAPAIEGKPERLFWTRRASLTARILAVNIIALGLMAGSLFYIDSYRKQLLDERFKLARSEAQIIAEGLLVIPSRDRRNALLAQVGTEQKLRLRLYNPQGKLVADSFALAPPSFRLIDPATEPWYQDAARLLDRWMDALLGTPEIPAYREPADIASNADAWPELHRARSTMQYQIALRYAPDRTPMISAAVPVGKDGAMLLTTRNAIDITENVRAARQTLAIIVALAFAVSIQLSLFLARTIVQPLRALVRAAVRVRLGRAREVEVPRLPERRDEIGMLARALSDMTAALRQRIDAVEHFAADVAHEIKNPLASLRSALDSLHRVQDAGLRAQLTAIALHDVHRIDRLVTEIADASRVDAELSRAVFEPIDLERLIGNTLAARNDRGENGGHTIRFERRGGTRAVVLGVPMRLERAIVNLLDNAVSFSPPDGGIDVILATTQERVQVIVCDRGPGIPESEREKVFERFHSVRPETEDFGQHSGLGLAIARTIAEAHEGTLSATARPDGAGGACLVLNLPLRHGV